MMKDFEKVFCIASGQEVTKKTNSIISKRNKYLNYGLLSLATILNNLGIRSLVVHGLFESPQEILNKCIHHNILESNQPILISVPSFFAVSWANNFISLLKLRKPNQKVILGGRWVIGEREDLAKKLFPKADLIVGGLAEGKIVELVLKFSSVNRLKLLNFKPPKKQISSLDYSLLLDREQFHLSIEVSRGCGMGCEFCQEKAEPMLPLKHPKLIINEVEEALLEGGMNVYFEASLFAPNLHWVNEFLNAYQSRDYDFKWRAEARTDSIKPKYFESLFKSGLRVLDIGLESASHKQLLSMGKTNNPQKYLKQASDMIRSASDNGIKTKINVLLYPGETDESIGETEDWLENHKEYITGISAGPVMVFGWDDVPRQRYLESLEELGASVAREPMEGILLLNLDKNINYEQSIQIANRISQKYMSAKDYFDLKSFSYFSRFYSYTDFLGDIEGDVEYSFNYKSGMQK